MQRMLESVQDFNFRFAIQTKLQRFLMIKNARLTGTVYGNVTILWGGLHGIMFSLPSHSHEC